MVSFFCPPASHVRCSALRQDAIFRNGKGQFLVLQNMRILGVVKQNLQYKRVFRCCQAILHSFLFEEKDSKTDDSCLSHFLLLAGVSPAKAVRVINLFYSVYEFYMDVVKSLRGRFIFFLFINGFRVCGVHG